MGPDALIAIDQEGGAVVRSTWVPAPPAAMGLGAANDTDLAIGGAVFLILLIVFFFARNAYSNHLVRRRVAPSSADTAGWLMFFGLAFMSAAAVLAILNASKFLTVAITGTLLVLGIASLAGALNNGGGKKAELKVDLRPTLFIGAGGTGMEVMMRIRRRILSAVWNRRHPTRVEAIGQFPVARFLHVDLDSGAIIDEGKSQRTDPWYELVKLSDEERLVESIDLPQYHESDDSLARFPLIESWMPLRPKKLRSLGIDPSKGAGQIRAVARLYLYDKYPKLRGRIKGALNFLSSNAGNERKENYQRLGLQVDTSKFRIVVIGSNAGGTGAGTAMDLGWIAKAIARQEVSDSQVDLVMFMPSGYAKANKERTEANAYATLMELETAMRDMNAQGRFQFHQGGTGNGH
eukprot:gene12537-14499_t